MKIAMATMAPMMSAPKITLWVLVEAPSEVVGSESLGSVAGGLGGN